MVTSRTMFCLLFHLSRALIVSTLIAAALLTSVSSAPPSAQAADVPASSPPAPAAPFDLRPGDHICLIGNTLAERMQHDGWLETFLQSRFPRHELVVRNLGFSGDELTTRLRSAGFGSPDEHLAFSKTDVVFAFFGFNESFAGEAGLAKFKTDLEEFVRHTLAEKYNGHTGPRLVLFSPIAHENTHDRNRPDGTANNARLALYTAAMRDVAKATDVTFVDLFEPTRAAYAAAPRPLTINGIHLTAEGNRRLAEIIDGALFARAAEPATQRDAAVPQRNPYVPARDAAALEKLRQAILDKDFHWFNRYRTVDGYSIYGGRADLAFVDGQTNRVVVQREMEVLDVMTANRDKRIWAVARGGDLNVDDGNAPEFIPVKTNKPGSGPGGTHLFDSAEAGIAKMQVAPGLRVNLFASEEQFPDLAKPVQIAFDTRGRLWVAVMPSYPHWKPGEELSDKVLILEDTDGDGRADTCKTFADRLHVPTGLEFWRDGLFVGAQPDLLFLKDTDGDDRADVRERVLHGLDSADTHHALNSFVLDPGGALYFQEGTFHHTQVETPWGPPVRCANAGVFRFEPRTAKFEVYASFGFLNPHGHVFDRWGQDIVHDGTTSVPYHGAVFSGHIEFPRKHPAPPTIYKQWTRPCPGAEFLVSRHFPDEMQGNLLVGNVIGYQGILQYKLSDQGASFSGVEGEQLLSSSDPNFRPTDMEIGPDGAIYFADWQNPIIGHMQHNLRDPSRDRTHGRIYRITYPSRPLLKPAKIAGAPIAALLDLLKEPEDRVRYRARIELSGRDSDEVIAAANAWLAQRDPADADIEHQALEVLWLHQSHSVVNAGLLKRMLASPDFHARAAAARVLCAWRDRVPLALETFGQLARDDHPRVRLEAVRAASFFAAPEAVDVLLASLDTPADPALDYTRAESLKTLEPYWKPGVLAGRWPASAAAVQYLVRHLSVGDLTTLVGKSPPREVCVELLLRPEARDAARGQAAAGLAAIDKKPVAGVLLDALGQLDRRAPAVDSGVTFDLARLLTAGRPNYELAPFRGQIERMALESRQPVQRELGFAALVAADGGVDRAWSVAGRSAAALVDFLHAVPGLADPNLRASLYPRILPLLDGLPANFAGAAGDDAGRVRRAAMPALAAVRGEELRTFQALARFVGDESDRPAAISAIARIPQSYWPTEDAPRLIETLTGYLRKLPAQQRTSPRALDAQQFAQALTALLPAEQARTARRELSELGVQIVRLGTLTDRMLFDKDRLAIQAGKQVQIVFENTDQMPHNFVIVRPGALEEVGTLAESQATDPAAVGRHYVPQSGKVLLSSRLLAPRQSQTLNFTAPREPGIYPYVCTYPGHWRRMFGALYVVPDLDDYLADPEAYLAAHPLPLADDLLKLVGPRKEWKFDDLSSAVGHLHGRNHANGKHLFQVATCVSCHRLSGTGQNFGPDLAQLDGKLTAADVLKEILDPSQKINEKFQTFAIETTAGRAISGIILEETADAIKVIENPLLKAEPLVLKKSEIVDRQKSPVSMMPKGLLDRLSADEILDLIAYVLARGDANHAAFGAGHEH